MNQIAIDFEAPRAQREIGMACAMEHAERVSPGWKDLAYQFLLDFARNHPSFISEDVSDASKAAGMEQPPTDRAWGSLYVKAAKSGVIVQSGTGRSRRRHNSLCPRWQSRVCELAE